MESANVVVIGGGVVELAFAARLSMTHKVIYDISKKNQIPFKRLGKLTVTTEESQVKVLDQPFTNEESSGVEEITFLDY